ITLEHLQRHALCRLLPYSGQNPQGVDELANKGAEAHGYLEKKLEAGGWRLEAGGWRPVCDLPATRQATAMRFQPGLSSRQNGILKPGGSCMPEVMPDIFSWLLASTLRTASLTAAAIRSSRMSLSSCIRLSSRLTRLTS